jgi:D-alanyl-D-alanine carboxypeptidase
MLAGMRAAAITGFVACFALTGTRPAPAESAAPAVPAADLATALEAEVAPVFRGDLPGGAVIVRKGDAVLLRKGYGLADVEHKLPVQPEMVFRLGSITKQFTAAAIMLLVESGKLGLTDDVRKWVPQYPDHGKIITIEHLLTHTSGVPSYTDQPGFGQRAREDLSHEQLLATFKDLPLDFPPGSKWQYSNSGYYLLGLVIEKVSRQRYADFVATRIFKPLGMAQSGYGARDPWAGAAHGYDRQGAAVRPAEAISMRPPFAAGGLVSTIDDLALWDRAIATGKLLTKAGWTRVFTPMKLSNGTSTRYGFGWTLGSYEGHATAAHGGGIPGFATTILRLPQDQVLVAILCNSQPPAADLAVLALHLAGIAIGKPIVDPPVVQVEATTLDRYAGVYVLPDQRTAQVRRQGGALEIEVTKGPRIEAKPLSQTAFFVPGMPARFTFAVDPKTGRIDGVNVQRADGSKEFATRR